MSITAAVLELRSPQAIRTRAERVLQAGLRGELRHFDVDLSRLAQAAQLTAEVTRARYPDLQIPPHSRFSHFDAGGVARRAALSAELSHLPALERARRLTEVVVTSVLLDAGAGSAWGYTEAETQLRMGRSEGLAIASLAWAKSGGLSSTREPYAVDAAGLARVTPEQLAQAFQVSDDNPLVGLAGRASLLRALGSTLQARSDVFGSEARLGALIDVLCARAQHGVLPAEQILALILDSLGSIWPGRLTLDGESLGDVWKHDAAGGEGRTAGLLPLHKLSQWLTYSLLHPLQVAQLQVTALEALTGLAEYRNGGLFVDLDVLRPKHEDVTRVAHEVSSEVIVEWRGLTVALLDRLAPLVRAQLEVDAQRLPLPAVLEGGTWAAGRQLANQLRAGGEPPIRVLSDGTVF